jgi:hypothetical protein
MKATPDFASSWNWELVAGADAGSMFPRKTI